MTMDAVVGKVKSRNNIECQTQLRELAGITDSLQGSLLATKGQLAHALVTLQFLRDLLYLGEASVHLF